MQTFGSKWKCPSWIHKVGIHNPWVLCKVMKTNEVTWGQRAPEKNSRIGPMLWGTPVPGGKTEEPAKEWLPRSSQRHWRKNREYRVISANQEGVSNLVNCSKSGEQSWKMKKKKNFIVWQSVLTLRREILVGLWQSNLCGKGDNRGYILRFHKVLI